MVDWINVFLILFLSRTLYFPILIMAYQQPKFTSSPFAGGLDCDVTQAETLNVLSSVAFFSCVLMSHHEKNMVPIAAVPKINKYLQKSWTKLAAWSGIIVSQPSPSDPQAINCSVPLFLHLFKDDDGAGDGAGGIISIAQGLCVY